MSSRVQATGYIIYVVYIIYMLVYVIASIYGHEVKHCQPGHFTMLIINYIYCTS